MTNRQISAQQEASHCQYEVIMNLTSELIKSLSSTNVTSFQTLTSHLFWGLILFSKINCATAPKTDHSHGKANRGQGHLKVQGYYEFNFRIDKKFIKHKCYVIPDLNKPLILGIDFIQQNQLCYCLKNRSFAWEGQPGPSPFKSLQCNCCPTTFHTLSKSYHPH
jgi:hypothetical protein